MGNSKQTVIAVSALFIIIVLALILVVTMHDRSVPSVVEDDQPIPVDEAELALPALSKISVINITEGCSFDPVSVTVESDQTLTFANQDTLDHTISFVGLSPFTIPAGFMFNVDAAAFFDESKTWSYTCDDAATMGEVGVISVDQNEYEEVSDN